MPDSSRPKVEWAMDRDFRQDGIVVSVWKLPLRRPKFRYDIGFEGKDDRVFRSRMIFVRGKGKLTFDRLNMDVLGNLIHEAEEYIYGEVQSIEDERVDRMIDYERRDLNKGKPRRPMGLKQLAKQDAAKRKLREAVGEPES